MLNAHQVQTTVWFQHPSVSGARTGMLIKFPFLLVKFLRCFPTNPRIWLNLLIKTSPLLNWIIMNQIRHPSNASAASWGSRRIRPGGPQVGVSSSGCEGKWVPYKNSAGPCGNSAWGRTAFFSPNQTKTNGMLSCVLEKNKKSFTNLKCPAILGKLQPNPNHHDVDPSQWRGYNSAFPHEAQFFSVEPQLVVG